MLCCTSVELPSLGPALSMVLSCGWGSVGLHAKLGCLMDGLAPGIFTCRQINVIVFMKLLKREEDMFSG